MASSSSRSRSGSCSSSSSIAKPHCPFSDTANMFASPSDSTILDAQITLMNTPLSLPIESNHSLRNSEQDMLDLITSDNKTADEVWREIVSGREDCKDDSDEMMTLEDFLTKAGTVVAESTDHKVEPQRVCGGIFALDPLPMNAFQDSAEGAIVGFEDDSGGKVRWKRGRLYDIEPMDRAAQQRQKRMIKNRESAARSRERKQAYQVELESLVVRLQEENQRLLREKEERTRDRAKQLMKRLVPVVEKRRPLHALRRVNSLQW